MAENENLTLVFSQPSCEALCALQADLLQGGMALEHPVMVVLDRFFVFLNELSAGMSAHRFSQFATLLDIGAVGGVALQNLLESEKTWSSLWKRLLAGTVSEGMMVGAARQYVKAFEAELLGVYRHAGWYLYREMWQLSSELQPDLTSAARRQALDQLFAPVHDGAVSGEVKAILLGRLFQMLLMGRLVAARVQ